MKKNTFPDGLKVEQYFSIPS